MAYIHMDLYIIYTHIYTYICIYTSYIYDIHICIHCIKIATTTSTTTTSCQNWSNQHQPPRRGPLATPRWWRPSAWYLQVTQGLREDLPTESFGLLAWSLVLVSSMFLVISSEIQIDVNMIQLVNRPKLQTKINLVRYHHIISISPGKNNVWDVWGFQHVQCGE